LSDDQNELSELGSSNKSDERAQLVFRGHVIIFEALRTVACRWSSVGHDEQEGKAKSWIKKVGSMAFGENSLVGKPKLALSRDLTYVSPHPQPQMIVLHKSVHNP